MKLLSPQIKAYQFISNSILPYSYDYFHGKIVFLEMYLHLMIPLAIFLLMVLIMVFDFLCTFLAELTRYPDHMLYGDFWNSTTMTEFLGKMSLIIPNFFKVHVLYELVVHYGVRPSVAKGISLAFSAAMLEVLMVRIHRP